jgi:glycosyltransferase involved in cell wall biosynthesis
MTETFYPVTGGGETASRIVAEGLLELGCPVTVITRRSDRKFPARDELHGIQIHRLAPQGHGHLKKWGMPVTALITLLKLRADYDVILVCGYRVLGIPALLASRLTGKPCIFKADNLGEWSGLFHDPGLARFHMAHDRFPISMIIRTRNRFFRRANRFIAISSAVSEELVMGDVESPKILRIPNSVDVDQFRPADGSTKKGMRRKLGLDESAAVAVYTGRLETSKGVPLLVRVWKRIADKNPNAILLLVGSGGPHLHNCEAELRKFVAENSLSKEIIFTGSVENVEEYLQAADLFVFPSQREAFGISVAEAMACGLPVVTTDIEGLSDVVGTGDTACLVPVDDESAFFDATEKVMKNPNLANKLGRAGRARAVELFSQSHVIRQYMNLVEDLAATNGPTWTESQDHS